MRKRRLTALLLTAAVLMGTCPMESVQAEEDKLQEETEKDKDTEETEAEKEVASVEDANETIASYQNEEIDWKEVYISNADELKAFQRLPVGHLVAG